MRVGAASIDGQSWIHPDWAKTPITALTANAFAEDKRRALVSEMNDFLAKPVHPDALFATLTKWLS